MRRGPHPFFWLLSAMLIILIVGTLALIAATVVS